MSLEENEVCSNDPVSLLFEFDKADPQIACNYWKFLKNVAITLAQMQSKLNEFESRIYTLEGLIK